jgi:Asp-tRNA(Asn)/Glu-tRNA(Gln) amidotransferase B subunit
MAKPTSKESTETVAEKTREEKIKEARENNPLVPHKLFNRFESIQLKFHDAKTLTLDSAAAKEYFSDAENKSNAAALVADIQAYLAIVKSSDPKHAAVAVQERNLKALQEWLNKYAA